MFAGFAETRLDVGGVRLRLRSGGVGPQVVLLHGHLRTHTTWHLVAPLLVAAGHTVVCSDLRGYGQSAKPVTTADHAPYASGPWPPTCWGTCTGWDTSASRSSVMTAAAMSPSGWPWLRPRP